MADVNNQCNHSSQLSSLDWSFQYYNIDNASIGHSTPPPPAELDFSTGYLQDVLTEWSSQSKRRRLFLPGDDPMAALTTDIALQNYGYWNTWDDFCCNTDNQPSENSNTSNHSAHILEHSVSDEGLNPSMRTETMDNELKMIEGQESRMPSPKSNVASSAYKNSLKKSLAEAVEFGNHLMRKKLTTARVVYPFELVKPGGVEGEVTLNDINERILMPPTRPVKHPVGDFACRPCVLPNGPGLSGKAVVGFTKIHTQGRGTITIVRTRG